MNYEALVFTCDEKKCEAVYAAKTNDEVKAHLELLMDGGWIAISKNEHGYEDYDYYYYCPSHAIYRVKTHIQDAK